MKKIFKDKGNAFLFSISMIFTIIFCSGAITLASGQHADIGKDPLQWDARPHSVFSSQIFMSVLPVAGHPDAEYKFECISGDAQSSDWQQSNEYRVSGLQPESEHKFTARVRNPETGDELLSATPAISVTTRGVTNSGNKRFIQKIDRAFENGEIELIPIHVTGNKDNRMNIMVINRWTEGQPNGYNTPEMKDDFIEHVKYAYRSFTPGDELAISPMPEYRDFYNLYAIWWPTIPAHGGETGMRPADYDEIRDRLFLPWHNEGRGWATIFAMFNSTSGGGGAGRTIAERIGNVMIAGRSTATFIHEYGHTALGLPDEYTSAGVWGRGGAGSNTSLDYLSDEVKWRAWIEPGTEVPTPYTVENKDKIGVFEGATHRVHHIYRSSARGCIMGAGSAFDHRDGLCAICIQRSVLRTYMWVNPFDSIFPARKELTIDNPGTVHFAVDVIKPLNDTQKLSWYLNGRIIARGVSEVDVTLGQLERYELECRLVDETPFVRPDLPFSDYPRTSVKWTIINEQAEDAGDHLTVDLKANNPSGANDGSITTTVKGGTPPYLFEWNDNVKTRDRNNLAPGTYKVMVHDAEYRIAEKEMKLLYPENFAPAIISSERDGLWDLEITGIDMGAVTCLWSDGIQASERRGLADGTYSCTITDMHDNQATREITLESTGKVFNAVLKEVIPSTGNHNNGSVCLHIEGGREPYSFKWSDGSVTDDPCRDFLVPGSYTVVVRDLNGSVAEKDFVIEKADAFFVEGLEFKGSGNDKIRISNSDKDYDYLWYNYNIPDYLPPFPKGQYFGTCETDQGEVYKAKAVIVENRGGVFIQDTSRNDFGNWILLKIYSEGENSLPVEFELNTSQDGRFAEVLRIENEKTEKIVYDDNFRYDEEEVDITWNGVVEDGYLRLTEEGFLNSTLELSYSSYFPGKEKPLASGLEFTPSKPGNYYVAAQNKATGAISLNRAGVAVTKKTDRKRIRPVDPSKVSSSNLLMWLDANDLSADGKPDGRLLRRGSANEGVSKAGDIDFHFFNYFPNAQNGKPIASWSTLWVQSLSKGVNNYQTIIMVRRESSLSGVGSSPYRELSGLIGVGQYGENLFHHKISSQTLNGRVRVNAEIIDPTDFPMPEEFYIASYEFDSVLDNPFKITDGQWEGEIAEILVFDSVLSVKELTGVEEYLRLKWISGVEY